MKVNNYGLKKERKRKRAFKNVDAESKLAIYLHNQHTQIYAHLKDQKNFFMNSFYTFDVAILLI